MHLDPLLESVVARLAQSNDARQIWTLAMMRHSAMVALMATFRWTEMGEVSHKFGVPGPFEYYPLLSAYALPYEEFRPIFTILPSGEHSIEGLYPPPSSLAGDALKA